MGLKPLDLRESSAKAFADKCAKQLEEAENDKEKIAEVIQALQEKLHAQATIVLDKRDKSTKANEELANIKEEVATAARKSLPAKGGEGAEETQAIVDDKADDKDEDFLHKLKEVSKEELKKYGLTTIGKEREGQAAGSQKQDEGERPGPKKTKSPVEDFDDLMAKSWSAHISTDKDGVLGGQDAYDQWAEKFKKGYKYSPY